VRTLTDEYVILVDENDNPIGKEEKVKCHLPNGKLHRAFTALLFDKEGRLIITRRSSSKMLWPGDWDGTVASHPREGETYVSSTERRMPEEIGISCKFDYLFKFEYHVPYKDVGSENEICGTLIGVIDDSAQLKLVEEEISEAKGISADDLIEELKKNPEIFCPWMIIALYLIPKSEESMLSKYKTMFSEWIKPEIKKPLEDSIKYHLPDNNWRLVN
jgi:isopentenyl-diphosphate delta-isomerase